MNRRLMLALRVLLSIAGSPLWLWRRRWNLLRMGAATGLLAFFVAEFPASLVRQQFAALPEIDYCAEARDLAAERRYDEALLVVDAGLESPALAGKDVADLESCRARIVAARDSWARRTGDFLSGAISGRGETTEQLVGAITADFFVVGDVRDLAIEGTRLATEGQIDPVIAGLSAVGVLTTTLPGLDVAAATLKAGRKAGAVTGRLAEHVARVCRRAARLGEKAPLRRLVDQIGTLRGRLGLTGTMRVLRHVDDPDQLATAARLVKRRPDAAFALTTTGADGLRWTGRTDDLATPGLRRAADDALVAAARKGEAGRAWLRSGRMRLLRPHPLVGLGKAWFKGTGAALAEQLAPMLDRHLWLLIPALLGWVVLEIGLLTRPRAARRVKPAERAPYPQAT